MRFNGQTVFTRALDDARLRYAAFVPDLVSKAMQSIADAAALATSPAMSGAFDRVRELASAAFVPDFALRAMQPVADAIALATSPAVASVFDRVHELASAAFVPRADRVLEPYWEVGRALDTIVSRCAAVEDETKPPKV